MIRSILFFCSFISFTAFTQQTGKLFTWSHGAVVRGDSSKKALSLVFTADEYGEGLPVIIHTLAKQNIKAGFFFTGRFYRNKQFKNEIKKLSKQGHYLGPHSDDHLLYCDWTKRDSLLVTNDSFARDIDKNIAAIKAAGLPFHYPYYFIPPFEWWNDSIALWSKNKNLAIFNFTPGMRTNVDYTWPGLSNYKSSKWIINWLEEFSTKTPEKLNGAIILIHAGTDPRRKDKFYNHLDEFISILKKEGYQFLRIDNLLNASLTGK